MRQRPLGGTGRAVSELAHGLWGMGGWSGSDDASSCAALRMSADRGCTLYDSAWAYGAGRSDTLLGTVRAPTALFASKVPPAGPVLPDSTFADVFPREHVIATVDRIRAALGRERVDLLQLHVWQDRWTADPAFADTVTALRVSGAVGLFGVSLMRWQPWNGLAVVASGLVDCVQVVYNIFEQAPEDELFPACREHGVGVLARVPLDEGSLTGTFTRSTRFAADDPRAAYFGGGNLAATLDRVEALRRALPAGAGLADTALRFALSSPDVSSVLVGMRTPEHVRRNVDSAARGPLTYNLRALLRAHRWDRTSGSS